MYRATGKSWTQAELLDLFSEYFGGKLSAPQLEQLVEDCAHALDERHPPQVGRARRAPGPGGAPREFLNGELVARWAARQ